VTVKGILKVQAAVDTFPTYSSVAATCDANQRDFFYIDPITNSVSYTTTSGQSYFTPPPNPLAIQYGKTGATLGFSTILDELYDVQSRDDLVQGVWSTMASNLVGTGGIFPFTDLMATKGPKRFYRVKVHF
jgi:hypothetical protein